MNQPSAIAPYQARIEASAPGRVNLMGEHTDYNRGLVLPIAIPQRTSISLSLRADHRVNLVSRELEGGHSFELGSESVSGRWVDYVEGVTWALRRAGIPVEGFDAVVSSTVPIGAGLSSSAALEVAMLRALRAALGLSLTDIEIANLAHEAESGFVGVPVGILDQMASSLADCSHALFLDTRDGRLEKLEIPKAVEIVVIDSGIRRALSDGRYAERRAECEEAASLLGVSSLREAEDLEDALARLPSTLNRRAQHVLTENARVNEAVKCLRSGDVVRLGALFTASHASMRDDFEVSLPAIDDLVAITRETPGCRGARLTGGGFGGAIVALVDEGKAHEVARSAVSVFNRRGASASVVIPVE